MHCEHCLYSKCNQSANFFVSVVTSERSLSPKPARRVGDDPFAIPGYREARDRYRIEHADLSDPYVRPHDEVPAKKLRPDYDFAPLSRDSIAPPIGRPVEAPIDCEIIIINKQQMYAQYFIVFFVLLFIIFII